MTKANGHIIAKSPSAPEMAALLEMFAQRDKLQRAAMIKQAEIDLRLAELREKHKAPPGAGLQKNKEGAFDWFVPQQPSGQ